MPLSQRDQDLLQKAFRKKSTVEDSLRRELIKSRIGATRALEEQRREPDQKEDVQEYLAAKARLGIEFDVKDSTIARIYGIKGFKKEKPALTTVVRKGMEVRAKDVPGLPVRKVKKEPIPTRGLWPISKKGKGDRTKYYLEGKKIKKYEYDYYNAINKEMLERQKTFVGPPSRNEDPLGIR